VRQIPQPFAADAGFAGVGHRRGSPDKVVMVVDAKRRRPDIVGQWAVLGSNQ
jgi:hypothetical protein